ncbi:hypothetical protein Ancab_012676 [Ancistrocladus abbreviatus]
MWCSIYCIPPTLRQLPQLAEAHQQKMETDEATAARLEAMKDLYNDPPRGTVKTILIVPRHASFFWLAFRKMLRPKDRLLRMVIINDAKSCVFG